MKLSVIGAGYVGLTTAACLAQIGHDVFCSESDLEKLGKLQNGVMPIFEPHLEESLMLLALRLDCALNSQKTRSHGERQSSSALVHHRFQMETRICRRRSGSADDCKARQRVSARH